jgi:hypothetical protein
VTAWLDEESDATPGLTRREVFDHADEIVNGMEDRVVDVIANREALMGAVGPVVLSTSDVLFIVDAYRELRQYLKEKEDA